MRPIRMWKQDIGDTLGMRVHEAGGLAAIRESLVQTVKRATFSRGLLHDKQLIGETAAQMYFLFSRDIGP